VIDRFEKIATDVFGVAVTRRAVPGATLVYFHSKGVRDFLLFLGVGYNKAAGKATPEVIYQSPIASQAAYLQGLFDTDGGANKAGIHFTSMSRDLIRSAQELLANLGVVSSISRVGQAQRVTVMGPAIADWCREVGFSVARKQRGAEVLRERSARCRTPKNNYGGLPNGKVILEQIKAGLDKDSRGRISSKYADWRGYLSRVKCGVSSLTDTALARFAEEFPIEQEDVLRATSGGFVDKVKSIDREYAEMMDIEVPEEHVFIGGVFVNHNSQGMTLDKVETDLSRCFTPGQAYVALSRARTSEGLFLRGTGVTIEAHPEAVKFYQQHCQG
jgi:intein/homing endonuclease